MIIYLLFGVLFAVIIRGIYGSNNVFMTVREKNVRGFILLLMVFVGVGSVYIGNKLLNNYIDDHNKKVTSLQNKQSTLRQIKNIEKEFFDKENPGFNDISNYIQKIESIDEFGIVTDRIHYRELRSNVRTRQAYMDQLDVYIDIIKQGPEHEKNVIMDYIENGGSEPNNYTYNKITNPKFRPLIHNKLRNDESMKETLSYYFAEQSISRHGLEESVQEQIEKVDYPNEKRDRIIIYVGGLSITLYAFYKSVKMFTKKDMIVYSNKN